jgi:hypothetical protein
MWDDIAGKLLGKASGLWVSAIMRYWWRELAMKDEKILNLSPDTPASLSLTQPNSYSPKGFRWVRRVYPTPASPILDPSLNPYFLPPGKTKKLYQVRRSILFVIDL